MSGQKLVLKKVDGREIFALHTEDGEILEGQVKADFINGAADDFPEVVVRFMVHDKIGVRVEGHE